LLVNFITTDEKKVTMVYKKYFIGLIILLASLSLFKQKMYASI